MKRTHSIVLSAVAAALLVGCGGPGDAKGPDGVPKGQQSGKTNSQGDAVSKKAAQGFETGLQRFQAVDKKGEWTPGDCKDVAGQFTKAAEEQKKASGKAFPEALYNAGLVYARCGDEAKARAQFEAATAASKDFHRARAQLALYDYQKSQNLDAAIDKLGQIIKDAKFQNVEALVSLAALQMERDNDVKDSDGKNDLERAKRNIQRALAIDDSYMPAFNQLAVYYMQVARKTAEAKSKKKTRRKGRRKKDSLQVAAAEALELNQQQLDLAALVTAQAIRKNPTYAPIHNTAGLIQVAQKNYNGAVKSFGRARALDPRFFEAHMNYAAVNLGFRGFGEAEKAYRAAIKLNPKTFEAHLGLALALRGQINDANFDKMVAESEKHLKEARKIAPDRAETYYNEAILTQEFKAKNPDQAKSEAALEEASKIYTTFVQKAGADPGFAQAVKIAKERAQDIKDTLQFIRDGRKFEAEQKKLQQQQKNNPPPKN